MKTVYTIGTTAEKIERPSPVREKPKVQRCENMQDAVLKAAAAPRQERSPYLLAPATICSPILQVRGQVFKELVEGLEA